MDQPALVTTARAGDTAAFATLVARYEAMAFGYALSILRDYHLAQDVTQEALYLTYRNLGTLRDAGAFPGWLRGIVRHQCARILRARRLDLLPLQYGLDVPAIGAGPELRLEIAEGFHRVLAAIRTLPDPQREVALLYYVKDYSHREIAAFLGLPATTVNNRLHGARTALRRRLEMTSQKIGRVVAINGSVVDVRFAPDEMPLILSALSPADRPDDGDGALCVVQHMGDGLARCLAHGGVEATPGMVVSDTGGPLLAPIDVEALTRALPILSAHRQSAGQPRVLETGIKVIDLMCPCTVGGMLGIFGPIGTGRVVISAEVLRNTARDALGVTVLAFIHGEGEARGWYDDPGEVPQPAGAGELVALPIENSIDVASPTALEAAPFLDARIYLSFTLAKSTIWPAIDPLLSTSRLMDAAIVGREHAETARGVRELLRRYRELQEGAPDGRTRLLSADDRTLIARARRVQRFFSQPFYVAEPFTHRPGRYVPLAETIRSFRALLSGAYDDLPEEAFLWRGSIDEIEQPAPAAGPRVH